MVPETLHPLFWDVNVREFDPHAFPRYAIARVLEFGDEAAVAWMRSQFSREQIVEALRQEWRLTPKSANFWALVYGVPADEVPALTGRSAS